MGQIDRSADSADILKEFDAFWRARAKREEIPTAPSIEASEIGRLMPHLMLLEVVTVDGDLRFRTCMVGDNYRPGDETCYAGKLLDEIDADHAERALEAAETGQPVYWRADGAAAADFPFASDGRTVDRVISVAADLQ